MNPQRPTPANVPGSPDKVDAPMAAVSKMMVDWELIDALLGGTRAMRDAGERYLPKRFSELSEDYARRVECSTLYPAFAETLNVMTGRAFAKPPTPGDGIPSWIKDEVWNDADLEGTSFETFAAHWFRKSLGYGLCHVLVEAPELPQVATVADQKAAKARPYCILLHPNRVLGWREKNGELTQLRVKFVREEDEGRFGTKCIDQVRVYEKNSVEVFEKDKHGEWVSVQQVQTGFDRIPIVTHYTGKKGLMLAKPPLRELAYLNAKHWKTQSGLDSLLDTAMVPILTLIGVDEGDTVTIGAKSAVKLPVGAAMMYVEHSGAAIGAGRAALDSLKLDMKDAGGKLLYTDTSTSKTVLQVGEEAARENSALGNMVVTFEDSLTALLDMLASTRGQAKGGTLKMNANLDPDFTPNESMGVLLNMANSGRLSDETLFSEAKRRKFISEDVVWDEEQVRIATSRPVE